MSEYTDREVLGFLNGGYVDTSKLRLRYDTMEKFQKSTIDAFWELDRGRGKMTYVKLFGYYPSYSDGHRGLEDIVRQVDQLVDEGFITKTEAKTLGHVRYSLSFTGLALASLVHDHNMIKSQSEVSLGALELYDSMTNEQLFESTQPPRPGRVLPPDSVLKRLDPNIVTGWMNAKGYDYDDELMDKLYDLDDFEGVSE